ncbi:hypothetical protein SAMN04490248_105135 [Salinihabitans flavidus]|uniref:LTXXQ motif family protein n=1 Tax=Salinihabitans flavidus TaxID=569882 RepID=A0A1H8PUI9_9RHOB|nr:hypothetical protein [Salinihabitans flavidus]SEO45223.1 hypothetical protein SAMN04490248_105135 [Salinihabitans flavidus]
MKKITVFIAMASLFGAVAAQSQTGHNGHGDKDAPYAGLQEREIKSLSESDLEELRRGGGWGLALPAELNGMPGPAHLLELRDEIGLSVGQVAEIEVIFDAMQVEAREVGNRLIAAEEAIEAAFRSGELDSARLRQLIDTAAAARADLRFIHLSRHLMTPSILTEAQIDSYNRLRGYTSNPCATVPDGHDPAMWRQHNNCD